jgi:hypothetical protein
MLADLFSVNSHLDFALCTGQGGRGVEKGAFQNQKIFQTMRISNDYLPADLLSRFKSM